MQSHTADEPRVIDILIIGGGIAGAATAYFLARHGHAVTLLERTELASEASGLNAGTLWSTGRGERPALEAILSMGALEILQTLQFDLGYDLEFRQCGALKALQTDEQLAFFQQETRLLSAQGYRLELLSAREARALEPELSAELRGCLYYPLAATADPVKTTRAFATAAARLGARILTQYEATALARSAAGYTIETTRGSFTAQRLVLAAGPWCKQLGALLGLHIPVIAVRGQMWATDPAPQRLFHNIAAAESFYYWREDSASDPTTPEEVTHRNGRRLTRHLYGRQTRAGALIFGGDRQAHAEKVPDPEGIAVNYAHAIELLPFLRGLPIRRTWAGWMPFTRHLQPMIGRVPFFDGLYILTGESSAGFEQGPMSGKLLADLIHSGEGASILAAADPAGQITRLEKGG